MLSNYTPVATLPSSDLTKARSFYEDTLGLSVQHDMTAAVTYSCGSGSIFVYESGYAGTNKATSVTFSVPDAAFDAEVAELRGKGIQFETSETEGVEWNDGVASMGGMRAVWFTDPDGNILNYSAGAL